MRYNRQRGETAVVLSLLIALAGGCAAAPASPQVTASGVYIKQDPITDYMRSQVGTPNELSPIAPAEATNIRKEGNRWCCDLNGQAMVFNGASSCWEPQR